MEPVDDPRLYSRRYQVTHLIARGGMAMVYRAQDTLLNRAVALKILYPELSEDPLFVERFRREAQAAANLSHPNIVPVFDWGEDDGTYFIVMELVDGTSLAEVLRDSTTVTPARSAQIIAQVAAALGYAHRSGVVHRDVKPGNILITSDGQVKVTDFGIAQAVSSDDHLAEEGSVMGTATYFSPEQAEGVAVDGRSDVYSLGVVLYEMLVGRPPFIGETPVAVSSQHVQNTVPPLRQFSDAVPHDLDVIVMEALGKTPSQRYQTADEFRADLIRFTEGQPVMAARGGAFYGADATRAVATVTPGERTQAVPIMTGPRTDIRRRRRGARSVGPVIAIVIILLAAAGLGYLYANKGPSSIEVPNVVGKSVGAATIAIDNAGLTVSGERGEHSNKAVNTVLSTDPVAGKSVKKGQAVTLVLSSGVATTPETVRDVLGSPLATAKAELRAEHLGFNVVQVTSATNAIPGVVLNQSPLGGTTVQSGTVVTLQVLASGAEYNVPSVAGDTQGQAGSTLNQSSLIVSTTYTQACSDTYAKDLVTATDPIAGSLVKAGESVTLVVSTGPCPVTVRDVVGDPETEAENVISTQGLSPSFSPDPNTICPAGTPPFVTQQSPAGGSPVAAGTTVDMLVCTSNTVGTTTTTTT